MKDLSHFLTAAVLGFFLGSLVGQKTILYAGNNQNADQMTIDEIADYLGKTWSDR